jgi:hypothetical protein
MPYIALYDPFVTILQADTTPLGWLTPQYEQNDVDVVALTSICTKHFYLFIYFNHYFQVFMFW